LFFVLVSQALRGEALVNPDALTVGALVVWAIATAVAAAWPFRTRSTGTDAEVALNWINP
jgi:hypothetical protein